MNRLQRVRKDLAQCNEDWPLRAIQLQLALPGLYWAFVTYQFSVTWPEEPAFRKWKPFLERRIIGKYTAYRLKLLRKACRDHQKEMHQHEQRQRAQANQEAQESPSETLGLASNQDTTTPRQPKHRNKA